ncbi:MAG: methylated-DNA--[protein]-cysteine S-methyltransferase [Desulfuromonadales bacterium]|nr:methylated-DNA--[protein]-cysteine S-methyltransferase [Desulfuromonadales bacterium]
MNQINIQFHQTRIGELILGSFDNRLCLLDFSYRKTRATIDNRLKRGLAAEFVEQEDAVLKQTKIELEEYLAGSREIFTTPLLMVGTDFQKSVWNGLLQVPYGTTLSYLELAKTIDNEKAVRAVASANGANAIGIIIPCHRIIESNGGIGGYAGGVEKKKLLLKLEKAVSNFK